MSVSQPKVRTTISVYAPLLEEFKKMSRREGFDVSGAIERLMEEALKRGFIARRVVPSDGA